MKQRLQQRLQTQISETLPGFMVQCEFTGKHLIDVYLRNEKTREAARITGVNTADLTGPGALDATVDQLLFEIEALIESQRSDK
ncbi:hypothetical protein Pres01_23800 [Metapseudomonas resinovorans]|uniref:hypothetical protein n=1 Tax=Metapseudomonas resinovorans TaxID=53412 RepID=UPI000984C136|nr:hypothetical protein [Pseudomonas resinovorans]GLZ86329.1 hypothetical protein Pres01_23800 [Pseudomonas resinovorans]